MKLGSCLDQCENLRKCCSNVGNVGSLSSVWFSFMVDWCFLRRVGLRPTKTGFFTTATNFRPRDRIFQFVEAFLVSLDVHLQATTVSTFDLCQSSKIWNITDLRSLVAVEMLFWIYICIYIWISCFDGFCLFTLGLTQGLQNKMWISFTGTSTGVFRVVVYTWINGRRTRSYKQLHQLKHSNYSNW